MELFPLLGFIDERTGLTILHLIGVALGVGGAAISDLMFLKSAQDGRISKIEMSFLTLGGTVVWIGLALLILSGIGIFFLDPAFYLASDKFLAKMAIVAILTINALAFHTIHIPWLKRHVGKNFTTIKEFIHKRGTLLASGIISIVSWIAALILGALHSVPYSFLTIMSAYLIVLLISLIIAFIARDAVIPSR